MKVYRKCPRTGFLETLETDGSYVPKGWSKTPEAAKKKRRLKNFEPPNGFTGHGDICYSDADPGL